MKEIKTIELEPIEIDALNMIANFCRNTYCEKCPLERFCECYLVDDTTLFDLCSKLVEEYA